VSQGVAPVKPREFLGPGVEGGDAEPGVDGEDPDGEVIQDEGGRDGRGLMFHDCFMT
jgi:hypothetical protein